MAGSRYSDSTVPGLNSGIGKSFFVLSETVQTSSGDHPASYSMVKGVRRPGSEADNSI
jgi:hypothetical protein